MKNKISILILSTLLFAVNACSDFIEVEQRGRQTLDNYFATTEECQTFVWDLYKKMVIHDGWWQLQCHNYQGNQMATDDAWMGNTQQLPSDHSVAHYNVTPTDLGRVGDMYTLRYQNISNCNYAIERIPVSPIDEAQKAYFIAQAKFIRAFNYYDLICNFGGVVLVTAPIGTSEMNKERSTVEESWQQVINDLIDAEKDCPAQGPKEALGRVTKGACQALLARAYLFKGDYQNAYNSASAVIQSGLYSLEPDFIDIWSHYNHNGVESIFEVQTSSSNANNMRAGATLGLITGARGQNRAYFPSNNAADVMDGWGWCVPSSDLENCYNSEGDEIRRKSTITKLMEPVYGDEELNPTYYFQHNKSERVIRKYYMPVALRRQITWDKGDREPLNIPVLRLGEMYLTRAEAAHFLNNPNQALADINVIRTRVKLQPKTGLTGNNLIYAIWKERRMELAFEALRLYDIRRQIDPVANKPMVAVLMGPNGTFVKYNTGPNADPAELRNTGERQDKGYNFDISKHLLWPIPQSEIDRSGGTLQQNPGYN